MGAAQKPRRFFPHLDCARPDNLEGFLTRCASIAERQQAIGLDWPSVHGRMPLACQFSAARQLDHASGGRGSRFRRLCTPRAPARVPRTGAGPDGRAGSTALRSAARAPPACAAGIMRSTRVHGAGIAGHGRGSAESPELLKHEVTRPLKSTLGPARHCSPQW